MPLSRAIQRRKLSGVYARQTDFSRPDVELVPFAGNNYDDLITPEMRQMVIVLAACGTPHDVIAYNLINPRTGRPYTVDTLRSTFEDELDTALERANAQVAGRLFATAMGTPGPEATRSQIFWLKTRARWRETDRLEITGKDGRAIEVNQFKWDLSLLSEAELALFETLVSKLATKVNPESEDAPLAISHQG